MVTTYALEKAAQAWCTDKTSGIVMDSILAEAFADILDSEAGEVERLRVQLAGCGVAALGGTADPASPDDYGWSPAYQDVLDLRIKYENTLKDT